MAARIHCISLTLGMAERLHIFLPRHTPLPPPQLVIHHSHLHRPRFSSLAFHRWNRLLPPSHPRTLFDPSRRPSILHRQVHRRRSLLQEMPSSKTRSRPSLLHLSTMRPENGSSLPLASDVRGVAELQGLSTVLDLYHFVLLDMFCCHSYMGLE